jgi:hypothetical protein
MKITAAKEIPCGSCFLSATIAPAGLGAATKDALTPPRHTANEPKAQGHPGHYGNQLDQRCRCNVIKLQRGTGGAVVVTFV